MFTIVNVLPSVPNYLKSGNMWHNSPKPDPSQPKNYSKINISCSHETNSLSKPLMCSAKMFFQEN